MKRILIVANSDGGLYKFRKELIEKLVCQYSVHIAVPEGVFSKELVALGCQVHLTKIDRKSVNLFTELGLYRQYHRIIDEVVPDCVLTYTIKPNIYAGIICASRKIPYISNITGLGSVFSKRGVLQFVVTNMYRFALRSAQKVFFQNEDNMSFMLNKGVIKGGYELLPGSGVNLNYYLPCEYPREDEVHFLFISRIMKEKGIEQFLNAARFIHKKYPYTKFHVCGRCEQAYEKILQEMQDQKVITYYGLVKDPRSIYGMSSCIVHPTYYPEGMSNVVLEGCASARPVITTKISGCKEIIDDGENGFLCDPKDTDSLIYQIERFLALPYGERVEMGLCGRRKVESCFDRNIVVRKYLGEIENGLL